MSRIGGIVYTCTGEKKESDTSILSSFFSCGVNGEKENESSVKIFSSITSIYGKEYSLCSNEEGFSIGENEEKSFVLLDGTILNKKALSDMLRKKNAEYTSENTEELLWLLYEKRGELFWEKLEGHFAFALYDGRKKLLYLVRDRLGSRNIYYFNTPSFTVFASSPAMLKKHPAFPDIVDKQSLWDFLSLQYVPSGTIFQDVRKVPPGAYAKISLQERTFSCVKKWWKMEYIPQTLLSFPEACSQLRKLLFSAVEEHLESMESKGGEGKGIFLSGGVDSAIIGAIASKIAKRDLKVFSMGFEESSYDERNQAAVNFQYMKNLSEKTLTHFVRVVPEKNSFALLEKLAGVYGEPYADASLLPTALLCAFAREEGCRCALCGDGADELFGGYERYLAMGYLEKMDMILPAWGKKLLLSSGRILLAGKGGERGMRARGKRFLESMAKNGKERYFSMICHTKEEDKKSIAGELLKDPAIYSTIENFDPAGVLERSSAKKIKECASLFDLANYLPNDCLMKTERASENVFLDLHAPFLHNSIVDFSLKLPYAYKEEYGYRKKILGETFSDLLPPGLARRKKRGFGVPLASFFRNGWKEETLKRLLEGELVEKGYFSSGGIEKLMKAHLEGKKDNSYLIFSLLMAELSLKN